MWKKAITRKNIIQSENYTAVLSIFLHEFLLSLIAGENSENIILCNYEIGVQILTHKVRVIVGC